MKIICINTMFKSFHVHVACIYLPDMRNAIDRNKALNKTNCLNLWKLMLNIGKMRWNADRWRKASHVST